MLTDAKDTGVVKDKNVEKKGYEKSKACVSQGVQSASKRAAGKGSDKRRSLEELGCTSKGKKIKKKKQKTTEASPCLFMLSCLLCGLIPPPKLLFLFL